MLNWLKILTELQKALPNHEGPFRVAVYSRCGSAGPQEEFARHHIEMMAKEVNAQSKFVLVGTYADIGSSAKPLAGRHGLVDLLADSTKGGVDLILTNALNRLGNKSETVMEIGEQLKHTPHPIGLVMEKEQLLVFGSDIREWTEKVARGKITPCQGVWVGITQEFPDHFGI